MILESWNLRYLVVLRYNFWNVTERLNFETGNVTDLFASNFARARDATTGLEWSLQWCNGITRSVLCCLSLSNVCSVIMHSDYTLSWTKCKLFDAGWLGQIVRFWYEFDHHSVTQTWIVLNSLLSSWGGHLFSSTFWQCLMSYLHFL